MDALKALGLNDKQQQAYHYLLETGAKTATDIASALSEQRTNVYLITDKLIELGLVERDEAQPIVRFRPTDPQALQLLMSDKQKMLARQSLDLKAALPALAGLYQLNVADEGMAYFEGLKGYEAALDDMVSSDNEVCVFGASAISVNRPDAREVLNRKFQKRALNKVPTRLLFDMSLRSDSGVPARQSEATKRYSMVRYWGDNLFGNGEIAIYGTTIVLTSYDDKLISLVLKNQALAGILQAIFNTSWDLAIDQV